MELIVFLNEDVIDFSCFPINLLPQENAKALQKLRTACIIYVHRSTMHVDPLFEVAVS